MTAVSQTSGAGRAALRRPPKAHPFLPRGLQSPAILVWLRRSHGWLGIWGAVAGILFGVTTVLMVHSEIFPAASAEQSIVQLPVNGAVIESAGDLGDFVKAELGLLTDARTPRNQGGAGMGAAGSAGGANAPGSANASGGANAPGSANASSGAAAMGAMGGGRRQSAGAAGAQSNQPVYVTQFTSPQRTLDLRYVAGNQYIEITRTERGFLNTLNRLHRGNGAQLGWTILGDAFSGGLIVLAVSGVLLWSRMDGSRLLAIGLGSTGLLAVLYFGLAGA